MQTSYLLSVLTLIAGCSADVPTGQPYPHNAIDPWRDDRAVLVMASAPADVCRMALSSALQIFRIFSGPNAPADQWVGTFRLNSDSFKSDSKEGALFLQAFQLAPGRYQVRLTGPLLARNTETSDTPGFDFQLGAGQLAYAGTYRSRGCSDFRFTIESDWGHLRQVLSEIYPNLNQDGYLHWPVATSTSLVR